jgi:arylsulfatase A-like enzyme
MESGQRPNILLITLDQQRFDTIRSLGNPFIRTPHMDHLVRNGVAFTSAYSDCPVCIPARWTLMNGLRAASYQHAYYQDRDPLAVDPARSLPGLLSGAGYQTHAVGKMHFWPERARYGFDSVRLPRDYYRYMEKHPHLGRPMMHGVGQNEMYPAMATVAEPQTLTAWTVEESIDFLETRDPTCPFFLWTSFSKPHPPLDPPEPYYSMYRGKPVPEPAIGDWTDNLHDKAGHIWDDRGHPDDFLPRDVRDDALRAYYGLITQVDYNLGRLFARMNEMDLWEETLILLTSDHGEMFGDHHGYGKAMCFEGSAHVPFVVKPPKSLGITPGTRCAVPVGLCDVLPTVMAVAGVSLAHHDVPTDGADVLTLIAEETQVRMAQDEPVRYAMGEISGDHPKHFITDGRWKYIHHLNGGQTLLFDLHADPRELHNLAEDHEAAEVLTRLEGELKHRLRAVGHADLDIGGAWRDQKADPVCRKNECFPGLHSTHYEIDVLH